jgi:hypothetical protein
MYIYNGYKGLKVHHSKKGSSLGLTSGDALSESGYSEKFEVSPAFYICGINGAGFFFCESLYQSNVLNHL